MPEYISRAAAMLDGFCVGVSCQECPFCDDPIKGGCKVARFIEAIPAADVKPAIHAHWYVDDGCAYCSNCRNNFKKAILKEAEYCPKCGAQIDGYGGHPDAGPPPPYDLLYEEGGQDE